jgi:transposase
MKKETITLNTQEQKRVLVLNQVQSGQLSAAQAAALLQLSERHVRRILAAKRSEGVAAIAHGNRGRQPARTIRQQVREQVINLARTRYQGCSQSHLRDLLEEREGIKLSRSTVRRILLSAGLISGPQRKAPKHRRLEMALPARRHAGADRWQSPCLVRRARPATELVGGHR